MSDPLTQVPAGPALTEQIAGLVEECDGVARIEPVLRAGGNPLEAPGTGRSIRVVDHYGVVDVEVSLTARSGHQARALARDVQSRIQELVTRSGRAAGRVEVSVLGIERRPSGA